MDQIIRKNAVAGSLMSPEEFKKLSHANVSWHNFERPYFFFNRELDYDSVVDEVEYAKLKNESIRHVVPYSGRYYDYIVRKEYESLNEWAVENGETLDNICYGVVKKHRKNAANPIVAWVELDKLVRYLDPNYTETRVPNILEEFDDIVKRLRSLIERMA
jgi:hypothetical protein